MRIIIIIIINRAPRRGFGRADEASGCLLRTLR
jgi:hypothetical protein